MVKLSLKPLLYFQQLNYLIIPLLNLAFHQLSFFLDRSQSLLNFIFMTGPGHILLVDKGSIHLLNLNLFFVKLERFGKLLILESELIDLGSQIVALISQSVFLLKTGSSLILLVSVMLLQLPTVILHDLFVPILQLDDFALLSLELILLRFDLLLIPFTLRFDFFRFLLG